MKRKQYERPCLQALEIRQARMLMQSNAKGINSTRNTYGDAVTEEWN
ncbi:MAG: hypothetical protein J5661_04690 [Bacteroidaceae bacterium]|nr:hypothetical protein [Bacteroidaceae bacterium]